MTITQAAYVAALFDSNGRITAKISDNDTRQTGFDFTIDVELVFNRSGEDFKQVVEQYFSYADVDYSCVDYESRHREKFIIHSPTNVRKFFDNIDDYIVVKREEVDILLEDIYPLMQDGKHLHKPGFLQIMERVKRIRTVGYGYNGTYTKEFFEEIWLDEDGHWDVEYSRKPSLKGRRTPDVENIETKSGVSSLVEEAIEQ